MDSTPRQILRELKVLIGLRVPGAKRQRIRYLNRQKRAKNEIVRGFNTVEKIVWGRCARQNFILLFNAS